MSPTATSKPAVPPIAEVLQPEDLKVIDLVRASLGDKAAERTKLVILRERAARMIAIDEEGLTRAMSYARGERAASQAQSNKGRASFYLLARKFILEDRSVLHRFESFGQTLLNGGDGGKTGVVVDDDAVLQCPECGKRGFARALGLSIHRKKMHGVPGERRGHAHGKKRVKR